MKTTLLVLGMLFVSATGFSKTVHVITNNPFPFSDPDIMIEEDDDIDFQIPGHNAVEVTKETYDANANSPAKQGGFATPVGGGVINFPDAGEFYYVCTLHPNMKGKVTVMAVTGVRSKSVSLAFLDVTPNPVSSQASVSFSLKSRAEVEVVLFNAMGVRAMALGKNVYEAGDHLVKFHAASLEDGLYSAAILVNGEAVATRKIVIKK